MGTDVVAFLYLGSVIEEDIAIAVFSQRRSC
jgi:hypothetical protein